MIINVLKGLRMKDLIVIAIAEDRELAAEYQVKLASFGVPSTYRGNGFNTRLLVKPAFVDVAHAVITEL